MEGWQRRWKLLFIVLGFKVYRFTQGFMGLSSYLLLLLGVTDTSPARGSISRILSPVSTSSNVP